MTGFLLMGSLFPLFFYDIKIAIIQRIGVKKLKQKYLLLCFWRRIWVFAHPSIEMKLKGYLKLTTPVTSLIAKRYKQLHVILLAVFDFNCQY